MFSIPGLHPLAASSSLLVVTNEQSFPQCQHPFEEQRPLSTWEPPHCSIPKKFPSTYQTQISSLNIAAIKIKLIVLKNFKWAGKLCQEGVEAIVRKGSIEIRCFVYVATRRSQSNLVYCPWEWLCMPCLLAWLLCLLVSDKLACWYPLENQLLDTQLLCWAGWSCPWYLGAYTHMAVRQESAAQVMARPEWQH